MIAAALYPSPFNLSSHFLKEHFFIASQGNYICKDENVKRKKWANEWKCFEMKIRFKLEVTKYLNR
jgi:hypothetical protein